MFLIVHNRLVAILLEAVNQPTLFFVGFAFSFGRRLQGILLLLQFDLPPAFFPAGLVFVEQQRRFLGRAALLVEIGDADFPSVLILGHCDHIADFDVLARLAALAVNMNLAAAHGVGGEAAGLEKPRGPQPFIDTNLAGLSQRLNHSPPKP